MSRICYSIALTALLFLSACAYDTRPGLFVKDEVPFNFVNERNAKVRAIDNPSSLPAPYVLVIRKPEIAPSLSELPHMNEYVDELHKEVMHHALRLKRRSHIIETDDSNAEVYADRNLLTYDFRSRVTYADTGSGWQRYVIGWGKGDVFFQWEGEITEKPSGRKIGQFIIAEKSNGNPQMGWNVKVFSGRYTMKKAMKNLAIQWLRHMQPFL